MLRCLIRLFITFFSVLKVVSSQFLQNAKRYMILHEKSKKSAKMEVLYSACKWISDVCVNYTKTTLLSNVHAHCTIRELHANSDHF
jgi:hypothetical protein